MRMSPLAALMPVTFGNFSLDFRIKQFLRGTKAPEEHRLWRWLGSFVPEELAGLLDEVWVLSHGELA